MNKSETIHYLEVLQEHYSIFQPEIRVAIDNAILVLMGSKVPDFIVEVPDQTIVQDQDAARHGY